MRSWVCYSQRPSSVRSTLMMKNMNPRAPSFCPPTSVFTQPSTHPHASSATCVLFQTASIGEGQPECSPLPRITFGFQLRQQTSRSFVTNQMSQIMSWVGFVILLKVWDGEGHIQVPDVFHGHHLIELLCGGNEGTFIRCFHCSGFRRSDEALKGFDEAKRSSSQPAPKDIHN